MLLLLNKASRCARKWWAGKSKCMSWKSLWCSIKLRGTNELDDLNDEFCVGSSLHATPFTFKSVIMWCLVKIFTIGTSKSAKTFNSQNHVSIILSSRNLLVNLNCTWSSLTSLPGASSSGCSSAALWRAAADCAASSGVKWTLRTTTEN